MSNDMNDVRTRNKMMRELIDIMNVSGHDVVADFLEGLDRHLEHIETELGRANAIIEGTWPNADDIIVQCRKQKTSTLN